MSRRFVVPCEPTSNRYLFNVCVFAKGLHVLILGSYLLYNWFSKCLNYSTEFMSYERKLSIKEFRLNLRIDLAFIRYLLNCM